MDFCVEALREALSKGQPEIFNIDQGNQFTSEAFTDLLQEQGIRISMDGKGRYLDNVFVERLWRSIKFEEVYLKSLPEWVGSPELSQCLPGVLQRGRKKQGFTRPGSGLIIR